MENVEALGPEIDSQYLNTEMWSIWFIQVNLTNIKALMLDSLDQIHIRPLSFGRGTSVNYLKFSPSYGFYIWGD